MAEENSGTVNLDLNLGTLDNSRNVGELGSGSYPNVAMNLEDWLESPVSRFREIVRHRSQRWRSLQRQFPIPPETQNLAPELIGGNALQAGVGSVATEERSTEQAKMCENGNVYVEHEAQSEKEDAGKTTSEEGSFFDCNICMELAKDPVVTSCGHLFCWPCLYQWLYHHSDSKECPVCKGEVTIMNVTPIYGRGNNMREPNGDCCLNIPLRPQAQRIESWRQTIQRAALSSPMEEMIRRLGSTFDLSRGLARLQSQNPDGPQESPERNNLLLNHILTSRGMRREWPPAVLSDDLVNLTERSPPNHEVRDGHRLPSMLLRRTNSLRTPTFSNLESALNSDESLVAERLVESYFHSNPVERSRELPPSFDDRNSLSSIAAVIHSESQALDNPIEIDSTVSLSTSSSRRRNGTTSRTTQADTGETRAPRRRRLN